MEQHWFGIHKPWHAYIGHTFGEYILIDYHNLPNDDPSNKPPVYRFILEYCFANSSGDRRSSPTELVVGGVNALRTASPTEGGSRLQASLADPLPKLGVGISDKKHQICYIDAHNILQLEKRI